MQMSVTTVYTELYIEYELDIHIQVNKYDCHIAFTSHKTNIIYGYIHQTFLHLCTETQPSAIYTSHVIAKYILEIYVPIEIGHICHIC